MLVALAAATFTIITFELAAVFDGQSGDGLKSDPSRIIEAVTAGVTTGAGLWLAGSLGLAAGAWYYTLGTILQFLTPGNEPPAGAKSGKNRSE